MTDLEAARQLVAELWAPWCRDGNIDPTANNDAVCWKDTLVGLLLQGLGTRLLAMPDRERPP